MTSVSVARRRDHDDSEEYSDASQDIEHNNSGHDGGQHESDYDSQGSDSDRSDQDSENKETERRVDDDEDRSNPQYIPKRGTFYEHDDRTAASGEESSNTTSETASEKKEGSEAGTERRRPPRKSDIVNKWSHDKYNENEQAPKSRDELVAIYGYDIRNEDAPPHARRNRRYGRGPNKYTRTWEDEEAYRRQNAAQLTPRKPPNPEDFPEFDPNKRQGKRTPRPRSKSQPSVGDPVENGSLRRQASIKSTKKPTPRPVPRPTRPEQRTRDSMPLIENLTITASVNNNNNSPGQGQRKVNATVAQQRPVPTDLGKKKPMINAQPSPQPSPVPNKSLPSSPGPQPTLKPQQQAPQQNQQGQQQAASGGSKRYSSLRQRPLAEPYATQPQPQPQQTQQPPPQQPPHRYHAGPNEFAANVAPPHAHAPHLMHQQVRSAAHTSSPPQHAPPAQPPLAQQINSSQVRLGILEQQQLAAVSHPHHTIHNMPQPHSIGQLQPSQAYAPPAMMPAQYMQQSGSGAVFGGAMFPAAPHAPHAPHATHAPHPTHASHATHASHGTHASHATHATHASHAPHPTHAPHATHATHAPYQHQMYPHHNYNACEQVRCNPMELAGNLKATQAGGVTYYNCAEQEVPPAPRTQRRPTAAIPIVSPHHSDRPANSTEKDNIDRIVENMFVRKPWPATHGADSKDKQLENRGSQEPPSKESSQPNSLTSSSISTDSKPSESREEKTEEVKEDEKKGKESEEKVVQESIVTDA